MANEPYHVQMIEGDPATHVDDLCRVYDEAFSVPPFRWTEGESDRHRAMLNRLLDDPSFALSVATLGTDLVGFAYGSTLPADPAAEPSGPTFHLIDLAVSNAHRRRSLGRRLLDMLLDERREELATLTVQPTAVDTQAFYRRLGWQHAGTRETPGNTISPAWEVYVLPLR